jgi:hypothetical protein
MMSSRAKSTVIMYGKCRIQNKFKDFSCIVRILRRLLSRNKFLKDKLTAYIQYFLWLSQLVMMSCAALVTSYGPQEGLTEG